MDILMKKAIQWLERNHWQYIFKESDGVAILPIQGKSGQWLLMLRGTDDNGFLVCHSTLQDYTPEAQRGEMAMLLTILNYGLTIGNFEMDFADGEVRFKTSIDLENVHINEINDTIIDNLMKANFMTMDRFKLTLEKVIAGQSHVEAMAGKHPQEISWLHVEEKGEEEIEQEVKELLSRYGGDGKREK